MATNARPTSAAPAASAVWPAMITALFMAGQAAALAAEPIKLGFSESLTGGLAVNGKQMLLTAQIWATDVNAKGGLLGRPVELVYYDDQSNPGLVPAIYTKLLNVDKVDLLFASGTNISSAAMPTIVEHGMVIMDTLALAVNEHFKYPRFFQTMPYGPDGKDAISRGFFEAAMSVDPRPLSVALIGADAEFSKSALEGARRNAQRLGLRIVHDAHYPPATVDYAPILRAVKAANSDLVFVASYPIDTAGILRSVHEIGLSAKVFGGAMVGLQYSGLKTQFAEQLNNLVGYELYVHEPTMHFPGIDEFLERYRLRAEQAGVDSLGYYVPPFTYATLDILAQAVAAVGDVDPDKLANYIHNTTFKTLVGEVTFGADGEWAAPRILTIQYRDLKGSDQKQFTEPGHQVILYPPEFKTGSLVYPFSEASR
jgi:branched-chain amino acid transport system substrate-binding protein